MSLRGLHDIRALWFGDDVPLLGHLHTPGRSPLDIGVVICAAPFGYENICGHRGLRVLGDRLAQCGIAALRFDSPGTGDSDGEQRLLPWKVAVANAVATLRRETSCTRVGCIGVGLGGTITLAAIDDGLDIDKLVLWGAPARGRVWLRQQRAYHRVTAIEPNRAEPPPPPPEGVEELSGFQMTSELAGELMALDVNLVANDAWPADRTRPVSLMIPRNASDTESDLGSALRARGVEVIAEAGAGFDAMFAEPQLSIAPQAIFARMSDWLAEGVASRSPLAAIFNMNDGVRTQLGEQRLVDETARYSQVHGGLLFSIETRPANRDPDPIWLIFLTGGAMRHIGPNRIWVRFARELAALGYASLRLDGRSVGDSEGEVRGPIPDKEYYQEHIYDDVERIMEIGVAAGAKGFLMAGICSGAAASYQVARRRSDVRGIVLLNPLQLRYDAEDVRRAKFQLAQQWRPRKKLWTDPEAYLRLLKGHAPVWKALKILLTRAAAVVPLRAKCGTNKPSDVAAGIYELTRKPVEVDIFLSREDPIAVSFLERHFGSGLIDFDRERLRLHCVSNTDHTIRPLFAQNLFFQLLRSSLERVAGAAILNTSAEARTHVHIESP